ADEEDEVRDVEAPVDRHVQSGHAQAAAELRVPGEGTPQADGEEHADPDPEALRRRLDRDEEALIGRVICALRPAPCALVRYLHPILLSRGRSLSVSSRARRAAGTRAVPRTSGPRRCA